MSKVKELENVSAKQLTLVRDVLIAAYIENPIRTTEELKTICRNKGVFLGAMYESAADAQETKLVNAANATIKDDDGNRLIHSVRITNAVTGKSDKTNYQESLFDLTIYENFTPKVARETVNKFKKLKGLVDNCQRKFSKNIGQQLAFDYDGACEAFGLNEEISPARKVSKTKKPVNTTSNKRDKNLFA